MLLSLVLCSTLVALGLPGKVDIVVENDLPFSDRHYTSGLELGVSFPETTNLFLHRQLRAVLNTVWAPLLGTLSNSQAGFRVGHEMYTPYRYWRERPQRADRPFAARLRFESNIDIVGPRDALTARVDAGPIGRFAFAEQLQSLSHTFFSPRSPLPEGWRWQLQRGLGIQTTLQYRRDILVLDEGQTRFFALSVQSRVRAGNLRIDAEVGPVLRFGVFGRNRPLNAPTALPNFLRSAVVDAWLSRLSLSFSLALIPRFVLHDAFIEGVSERDLVSVQRHWATGRLEAGWDATFRFGFLRTTLVFAAPAADVSTDVGQQYWSIGAGVYF